MKIVLCAIASLSFKVRRLKKRYPWAGFGALKTACFGWFQLTQTYQAISGMSGVGIGTNHLRLQYPAKRIRPHISEVLEGVRIHPIKFQWKRTRGNAMKRAILIVTAMLLVSTNVWARGEGEVIQKVNAMNEAPIKDVSDTEYTKRIEETKAALEQYKQNNPMNREAVAKWCETIEIIINNHAMLFESRKAKLRVTAEAEAYYDMASASAKLAQALADTEYERALELEQEALKYGEAARKMGEVALTYAKLEKDSLEGAIGATKLAVEVVVWEKK